MARGEIGALALLGSEEPFSGIRFVGVGGEFTDWGDGAFGAGGLAGSACWVC
jgi:hypothetical protein